MKNENFEDTKESFIEAAKLGIRNRVEAKILEAMFEIISSQDMIIASALGIDVTEIIREAALKKIEDFIKE